MKNQKRKSTKKLKKLHRIPGLIVAFFLLYYSISGIVMNHRELFSGLEVARKYLPEQYQYNNWNNASLKGNIAIDSSTYLLYGNIGVLEYRSDLNEYKLLNQGFGQGEDRKKISHLIKASDGNIYAATLFGLYHRDSSSNIWVPVAKDLINEKVLFMQNKQDTLFVMTRSNIYKGIPRASNSQFIKIELAKPSDYTNQVGLFQTIWQIHSGEIFGISGKLFVDFLGIICIVLSLSGIFYFAAPKIIRRKKKLEQDSSDIIKATAINLRWHNQLGKSLFVFLVILCFSGIFLRPPLLIPIANVQVPPIKFSHLDQPNPWHDKLRAFVYNPEKNEFIISSLYGMYRWDGQNRIELCPVQAPVSVMGINAMEAYQNGGYLIASFSGVYLWHPDVQGIYDLGKGQMYTPSNSSRPIGEIQASGVISGLNNTKYIVDYNIGLIDPNDESGFGQMPNYLKEQAQMSWWNLSLEIHTGRIFQSILSDFYILLVPISGILCVMVLISGYIMIKRRRIKL